MFQPIYKRARLNILLKMAVARSRKRWKAHQNPEQVGKKREEKLKPLSTDFSSYRHLATTNKLKNLASNSSRVSP